MPLSKAVSCTSHSKQYLPIPSSSIHIYEVASLPQYPTFPGTLDGTQKLTPTPNTSITKGHWAACLNSGQEFAATQLKREGINDV